MNLTDSMRKMLVNAVAEADQHGNKHLVSLRGSTFYALIRRDLAQFTGPSPVLTNEGLEYVRDHVEIFGIEASGNASRVLMKIAEEELRAATEELLASATPIVEVDDFGTLEAMIAKKREAVNAQAEEADLLADAAAILLVSSLTGMSPEDVIAETGGRSPKRQKELAQILSDSVVKSIFGEEPAPVALPDLPEGCCGYVLHEEIQCTLDPHEGTEHGYAPASYMNPLPFTEEKIAAWHAIGAFDECVRAIRETRDEYIRNHEENLVKIAHGDTSVPDSTERARKFRDVARTVIEEYGLSGSDVVHAHDAGPETGNSVAICTRFPKSDYIASIGTVIGMRIAEITGEDLGCDPSVTSSGNIGFLILPADKLPH